MLERLDEQFAVPHPPTIFLTTSLTIYFVLFEVEQVREASFLTTEAAQ